MPLLSSPQHERYFFTRLENPFWIEPLRKHGLFKTPPSSESVKGGGTWYPLWPPSEYLARMASKAPQEVVEIFKQIQTDNWNVARDILNAAKAMPGQYAKHLVSKIAEFVHIDVFWHNIKDVSELCAKLAREGEVDAAMSLVLDALSLPTKKESRQESDEYWYIEGLKQDIIPALIPLQPKQLLEHLCEEVKRAFSATDYTTDDSENDSSCWWRPAIEEHGQNSDYQLASKIVSCLREGCEIAINKGHLTLNDILDLLGSQQILIFKRLRVHLIRVFADRTVELARETILRRELFADELYKHEYALLVGECFNLLTKGEQNAWLSWVDEGPEANDPNWYDPEVDAEMRQGQKEWWQFYRLLWVRQHLSGQRKEFVEKRLPDNDDQSLAFFNVYTKTRHGSDSPSEVEQLSEMGFEKAVEFVASWRPDGSRHFGPSVEGLGQTFGFYVASDPTGFSAKAALLKDRPAIYVRSFLRAMEGAVKEDTKFDICAVLDLCRWVTEQPIDQNTSPTQEEGGLVDRNWQYCRDAVAELVEEICEKKPELDYKDAIWSVIKPLLEAPSTSYIVRDESKDPCNEDYGTPFINSSLGKALKALFEYARWIAKSEAITKNDNEVYEKGIAFMPEVKEALEAGLAPDSNFGFIGRAGYGWYAGLLYWIDKGWLEAHTSQIFDLIQIESDASTAYGWAAWNTFLQYNRPHKEFYRILRKQFSYAVDQVGKLEEYDVDQERTVERLGVHLMVLYGRGDIGDLSSGTDQQILERFLKQGHQAVRTRAVKFVGSSLRHREEDLPKEVQKRFMNMWEWYWEQTGKQDAATNPESSLFGWWFVSGAFPVKWSIGQLDAFTAFVPKPKPDSFIVEELAKVTASYPLTAVRILTRMVKGDDDYWRVGSWREEAYSLLEKAMRADAEARTAAESLIDQLGRRGFTKFGELLNMSGNDSSGG